MRRLAIGYILIEVSMLEKNGCWIERLDRCGTWEEICTQAHKCGFGFLVVKAGDAYRNNQMSKATLAYKLEYAHDLGIQVLTYNDSRPQMWNSEVHLIADLLNEGVDGHVLVPTEAWQGQSASAGEFMNQLRKKTKGFVAYRLQANQSSLYPAESFGAQLDAFMPLLEGDLDKSLQTLEQTNLRLSKFQAVKPIYPIFSTRGPEQVSKAMSAFEDISISLESWEKFSKEDVGVFPFMEQMKSAGLFDLDSPNDEDLDISVEPQNDPMNELMSDDESDNSNYISNNGR